VAAVIRNVYQATLLKLRPLTCVKNSILVILLILFPFIFSIPHISYSSEDKNGVSPTTISLPSGPGSIEGLGSSFQPMLNTGSARYSIAIAVPPGTAGHVPSLTLQYDSGLAASAIAPGWTIGPGSISRNVDKGIPRYVDGNNGLDDDFDNEIDEIDENDIFVGPDGEELVRIDEVLYRARIEGGFGRFRRLNDGWEVDLKNGATLTFGGSAIGRVTSSDGSKVFRWLLEKSEDSSGNTIEYHWAPLPGSHNQKYLKEIRYGPGAPPWSVFYFVSFGYERRPDWRKDFRSSFPIITAHRLGNITIGIQGQAPEQCAAGDWNLDSVDDALIGRYKLDYEKISPAVSQLIKVTRFGADNISYLPPIRFEYNTHFPEQIISAANTVVTARNTPENVMDSELVDLIDLNRDGLPDILQTDYYGTSHYAFYNLGQEESGALSEIIWSQPVSLDSPDHQAVRLHLAEDRVNLADMNGDGISDLVHTSATDEVFYYINEGKGSWASQAPMSISETSPPPPFMSDNVKTADLDFNKRIDVVKSTENGYTVWLNYRNGVYSRELHTAGAEYNGDVIQLSETGVDFGDMNGDRLSDVVQVMTSSVLYCASKGHGDFFNAVEIAIPDTMLTDGTNGQIARAKITDINGDGLSDLVVERAVANELWCWLNLGNDTFSSRITIIDMVTQYSGNTAVRWADMNGNGSEDLIYADSSAVERLRIIDIGKLVGGSAHPNLLSGIDNGLGRRTSIAYTSSTEQYRQAAAAGDPWTTTIPFPVPVVQEVTVSTGLDLDLVPGPDIYKKYYVYRDGFYEDREHQFRGFAKVTVTEPGDETAPTQVTINEFFTGGPDGIDNDIDGEIDEISVDNHREEEALKGMVKALEIRDAEDTLYNRSENLWEVRVLPLTNPDNKEIRLALNPQSDTFIYEGETIPEVLRINRTYDDFGNVVQEYNHGALSLAGDEIVTTTDYINDSDNWLIGLVYQQIISDAGGQPAARTRNFYDGPPFIGLPVGDADRGLLTRQQAWVEGSDWINSLRNSYDSYGNIIAVLDPNGNRRSLFYDDALYTYPVQEDIEVAEDKPDLSVRVDYNTGLGVISSSLVFNDHETRYHYDSFGRLVAVVRPGDSEPLPTQSFDYSLCDPAGDQQFDYSSQGELTLSVSDCRFSRITTRIREVSGHPGTLDSDQFVDGMGRKVFTLVEGESDYIVKERVLYNARGSVQYSFLPYRDTVENAANSPLLTRPHFEKIYDGAGREVQIISPPDEHGVNDSSNISYQPLTCTITDERGNNKTSFTDGLERLITVHKHNGGETYVTLYGYNTTGNLVSVLDNQNNLKTMLYDGLGRKTAMADPDRGTMEYWYDAASNLIRTRDNKGQEIVYTYDRTDRMLSEDYLDGAGLNPDVQYSYDQADNDYPEAHNLLGRLAFINDLSGGAFFSYDQRGNSEWNITRINDGDRRENFRFTSEFDAMGRVTASIYPDGDRVEYFYNQRGLLDHIPGFINNIEYHVSGATKSIDYANGVNSTALHDSRHRLLETTTTPQVGEIIQHLHYSFDPVSNISAIADMRPLAADLPENASQSFQYDDLNRLVHAEGSGYGGIDFQYDSIGNMIHKVSPDSSEPLHIDDPLINLQAVIYGGAAGSSNRVGRLPGDDPGPHAVTSTESGLAYQYDDNGNVTGRTGDHYEWDFADRLIRTTTADSVTSYIYNAAGQRVVKKVKQSDAIKSTWYVNDGYEIREDKTEKYIFAGSRRIARVTGRLTAPGDETTRIITLQSGMNFISIEMTVPLTELLTVIGQEIEVWTWDGAAQQYLAYIPAENRYDLTELEPGRGYIIRSGTQHTLFLTGTRVVPDFHLVSGWNLVGCLADREMSMAEVVQQLSGQVESVWEYDTVTGTWRNFLAGGPDFLNFLAVMIPGRAYWLQLSGPVALSQLQTPQSIHFYHPDHLSSSSLITDSDGSVAERVEYFPYGRPRYQWRDSFESPYKYTDKELDKETGLLYYEARYYDPVVGRFMSVDPLLKSSDNVIFSLYTYVNNNPQKYVDPTGKTTTKPQKSWEQINYPKAVGRLRKWTPEIISKEKDLYREKLIERHGVYKIEGSDRYNKNLRRQKLVLIEKTLKDFERVSKILADYDDRNKFAVKYAYFLNSEKTGVTAYKEMYRHNFVEKANREDVVRLLAVEGPLRSYLRFSEEVHRIRLRHQMADKTQSYNVLSESHKILWDSGMVPGFKYTKADTADFAGYYQPKIDQTEWEKLWGKSGNTAK